jgi:hypothetical protein
MENLRCAKLVVGELEKLSAYRPGPPKNGFQQFMLSLAWRIDDGSGELYLDNEDINRLARYARTGYKQRVLDIFGRSLNSIF